MDESMLGLAGNEVCYVFCSVKGASKRSGRLLKTSVRARVYERERETLVAFLCGHAVEH